jgi:hypothetical protein
LFGFCLQFDVSCLKVASLQFEIEKGIASVSGAEAKGNQTEKAHLMEIQSMVAPLPRRLIMATNF